MNVMRLHNNNLFIIKMECFNEIDLGWGRDGPTRGIIRKDMVFIFLSNFVRSHCNIRRFIIILFAFSEKKEKKIFIFSSLAEVRKDILRYISQALMPYTYIICLLNILHKFMGKTVNRPSGTSIRFKIETKPTMLTWIHCLIL